MTSPRLRDLLATIEALGPYFSAEHCSELSNYALRLAGQAPAKTIDLEQRRAERELGRRAP